MPRKPEFPTPIATVDVVLLTLRAGSLSVGLIRREQEPFAGSSALPGGYVHVPEDVTLEASAVRILREKAKVDCRFLEQLGTFSGAARDPRGWSLTVAYFALMPEADLLAADAALSLHPVDALPPLAFDHAAIVEASVARLRGKSSYSALPAFLLPPLFTLTELHAVYQQVLGTRLDRLRSAGRFWTRRSLKPLTPAVSGRTVPPVSTVCGPAARFRSTIGSNFRPARPRRSPSGRRAAFALLVDRGP